MHYQEFLPADQDWRILLCEGKALPWAVVRRPAAGDFRTNTHQGGAPEARPLSLVDCATRLVPVAEKAGQALGRPYARVDLRSDRNGNILVREVNRTPRLRLGERTEEIASLLMQTWLRQAARLRQQPS